ncbi:MAG: HAD-IIB family hydrolase [Candidatus Pacebacteria bacterium]|nr:HAD-IIB family hydrolase [Candidatus Paceibacterota bacterium]
MIPKLIIFDLDNTLAASKEPITDEMADLLTRLIPHTSFAVISGGKLEQLQHQVIERMTQVNDFSHIYLLPTSGAAMFAFDCEVCKKIYEEELSPEEVAHIEEAIDKAISDTQIIDLSTPSFGERIEFRGAEVTLSALGQEAPIAQKVAWDPDGTKRSILRDAISKLLPEYDVKRGGSTSIDVTRQGINKAYGIRKLSAYAGIPISEMVYVGDALFPSGNDEVVKETGIPTQAVQGPEDTATFIRAQLLLAEH